MVGALTAIFIVPVIILNSLAGLVGGAWLLWLGEWKIVLVGFLAAVSAPFWISILLIPGLIPAVPGLAALERGHNILGTCLASISALWTYFVVTAWCLAVFWYVPRLGHHGESIIPFFLFAYSTATGPWAVMAQKESQGGGGETARLTLSAACIGCALILGYVLVASRPVFTMAIWLLAVPMAAAFLLSLTIAIMESRHKARYGF
jgi:hypothetical protein